MTRVRTCLVVDDSRVMRKVAIRIVEQLDFDGIVVVFCSAESRPERIRLAIDQGAAEYIMKPFDGDIIASKFEAVGLI